MINYCINNGITVTAYSPLGGSKLVKENIEKWNADPKIKAMCDKYKKAAVQVILRWHVQKWPKMYSVIPKTLNPNRISENFAIFDFKLTDDELKYINSMDAKQRSFEPMDFWGIPVYD